MGGQLDAVGLAPASDLASLGQTANDTQIDTAVVDQVFFNQLAELPLAGELFAGGQRNGGLLAETMVQVRVLGPQRILHEEGAEWLAGATQAHRVSQIQAG